MPLKGCKVCHKLYQEDELILNKETGTGMCLDCICEGIARNGSEWYIKQMDWEGEEKEDMTKKINVSKHLWCPGCCNYTYDETIGVCTTPTCGRNTGVNDVEWVRQRLEFARYVCPFCLGLNIDVDNKICLVCKAHLGKKAMTKRHNKECRKGKAAKTQEACTRCGSLHTWPERGYCHTCHQIYRVEKPESDVHGFIDGGANYNRDYTYLKVLKNGVVKVTYGVEKTGLKRQMEFLEGGRRVTNEKEDNNKGDNIEESADLIKVEAGELNELPWKEIKLLIPADVEITVRYLEGQEDSFGIKEYKVAEFDKILTEIPMLVKDKIKEKK